MLNVLVRDVPDDVHARLQARAEARGMSLQRLLVQALAEIADRADIATAVAEWESLARSRSSREDSSRADTMWVSNDVRVGREERDEAIERALDGAARR